eukprot:3024710-Amphidinium_carterae.1
MGRAPSPTPDFCKAARKILADNLQQFELRSGEEQCMVLPAGPQQDCFEGREDVARTEGHLADASAIWVGGGPATPWEILQDFFPSAECKYITVTTPAFPSGDRFQKVPLYVGLR